MTFLPDFLSGAALAACLAVALIAGLVKGLTGFAMPMIMISGMGSIVGPEWALAGLLLPTLATNVWQALRQGPRAAWAAVKAHRIYLGALLVMLLISAQLVRVIPERLVLIAIGGPILLFALSQLLGRDLRLSHPVSRRVQAGIGSFAGFIGGISGVWGPPTVAYLTALDTPKTEHVRVQGVIYGCGAAMLVSAHVASGVLRAETLPFSLMLLPLALLGMFAGFRVQDRIDQRMFRKAILLVLLVAGGNLLRQGIMG